MGRVSKFDSTEVIYLNTFFLLLLFFLKIKKPLSNPKLTCTSVNLEPFGPKTYRKYQFEKILKEINFASEVEIPEFTVNSRETTCKLNNIPVYLYICRIVFMTGVEDFGVPQLFGYVYLWYFFFQFSVAFLKNVFKLV